MSKLQTYVLKEVMKAFVLAFVVLLAVMMLGFGLQLLQEGLDIVRLRHMPFYMVIYCAPWVLPSALLTSVIMVFGRLSADKEILAMQVEGMHLWHILYPVYFLALLVSFLGVYLHFEGAPYARYRIESMEAKALMQVLRDRILYSSGKQFYVSPYMVSYESYDEGRESYDEGRLKNVKIMQVDSDGVLSIIINAKRGDLLQPEEAPNMLRLVLEECAVTQLADYDMGGPGTVWARRAEFPMQVGSMPDENDKSIKHMSYADMKEKSAKLKKEIEEFGTWFKNPGEKNNVLADEINGLHSQRNELKRARDRVSGRLNSLNNDLHNEREVVKNKKQQLERRHSNLMASREQRIEYLQTLEQLMAGEDENRLQRISEVQKELSDVRDQIDEVEKSIDKLKSELEHHNASMAGKKQNLQKRIDERAALDNELQNLSEELREFYSARRVAWTQEDLREIRIRQQRRLTLAFAALMFTVLGIPLGLFSHKRSTLLAFGVGFLVMLIIFYPFMVLGQIIAETGMIHVVPAMWMGNGITFLLGIIMTGILFRR